MDINRQLDQKSSSNQGTQHCEEVHRASVKLIYSLWQQTLCWVWLRQNNTSTQQPTKSNQRKYFKRNDCARKEEAFAPLLNSGRLLLKSESQRSALCQGHKGKLGWHACYFPSLLSSVIIKIRGGGQAEKTGTTSHPFSWQQRRQLCPVHTWIPDKEAASCRATAGGLQATHTRPYKGTPFNWAVRLLLCLWQHLSMHFVIVLPSEKELQRLLRLKWYWITSICGRNKQLHGIELVIWNVVCSCYHDPISFLVFAIISYVLCFVRGSSGKVLNKLPLSKFVYYCNLNSVPVFVHMCLWVSVDACA